MRFSTFSIYDSKAQAFLPPFILPRVEMAQRAFSDCVNSPTHQFGANPADFTLFILGDWDDETAEFRPLPAPKSLGLAQEYVKRDTSLVMDDDQAREGRTNGKDESNPTQQSLTQLQSGTEGDDPEE